MRNMWKRSLSLVLAMVMIMGMLPMGVFATEDVLNAHEAVEAQIVEDLGAPAEEPAAEEPAEEPAAEETEEEPAEEPVVEEPAEEPAEEAVVAPVEPVAAGEAADALTGIVWLDKNRDNDLMTKVTEGGLREMVLTALDMEGSSAKVFYNSKDGSKKDVSSLMDLMMMYEELKDVLTGEATLGFTIGSGASAQTAYITLKNIAHLQFAITVPQVVSVGEPADLTGKVQAALNNATITVTHGSDIIDWEKLPEALCKVERTNPGSYTWPNAQESAECAAKITIAICDSVDGKTVKSASANVVLVDNTPSYTVSFVSEGNIWKQYNVLQGAQLPAEVNTLKPNRAYYTFGGWEPAVDASAPVTAAATYTAKWTADMDNNGNGKADQEEFFNVTFKVDGSTYKTGSQRYGTATILPETNPSKAGFNFLGWAPEGDEYGVVADTVTEDVVYVAKWAEDNRIIVDYTVTRIGLEDIHFQIMTNEDGIAVNKTFSGMFDGWYLKGTSTKFNFSQKVTEAMATDGVLYLTATLGADENGNGKVDGTEADPYVNYVFQRNNGEAWVTLHDPAAYGADGNPNVVDTTDVDTYWHPDTLKDNRIHTGWKEGDVKEANSGFWKIIYMHPVFADDLNNNTVADAEETAKITAPAGEITKANGLTKNGTLKAEMGTVQITGLNADGTFLYNSNGSTAGTNGAETVIVAKPAANHYVYKVLVNGVEQADADDSNNTYTVNMTSLKNVTAKSGEVKYEVEVIFQKTAITFKSSTNLTAGQTYTEKQVYDAVVESPARAEDDTVYANYVARAAKSVTVDVSGLRKDIEQKYGKVGQKVIDKMWPGDKITVELTEVVKPVTYKHEGMVKTAQQVTDSYILELQSAGIAEIAGVLSTLKLTIQSKVRESAEIRPFLYNESGKSFEETIEVTYEGSDRTITGRKTFTLADNRTATSITVSDKTVTYGSFKNADLLKDVTLNGITRRSASGTVKLADNMEGSNARTYKNVPVYFAGDADHQPSQASFQLTVNKRKVNKLVVDNIIVDKHGDTYNAAPVVDPSNVPVISVVAGLDLNELDLDLSKNNPYANLKNINAKAWIKLPENLKEVLALVGVDTSVSRSKTLAEIEKLLRDNGEILATLGVPASATDTIIKVLNKVNDYAEAETGIEVFFSDNVYPSNPGVYVNLALTADANYESAYDLGTILIAPVVALPNRGDVALKYKGVEEHLFALTNDGTKKTLDVYYKGSKVDADVFYYGFNSKAAVHSGTTAPSLPGVYVASTIYTDKDENGQIKKLGSDAAILVIGMTDVDLDVSRKVVVADGNAYAPDVTVTKKDGTPVNDAAVTLISGFADVDTDAEIGIDALIGNVNIDFPDAVHKAWKKFFKTLNNQDKVNLPHVNEDLSKAVIDADTLVRFLNWCCNKFEGEDFFPATLMQKLDVPQKYIDKAEGYSKATVEKLLKVAEKLAARAKKIPGGLSITFEKDKTYTDNGVYFYMGIVTDPDYIPAANAGLLVIKADPDDFYMYDTHTPYNGKGQKPEGVDNTGYEGFTLVVDKKNNTVNLIADDHMMAAINKFEKETGITLNNATGGGLYNLSVEKLEQLAGYICNAIYDKAVSLLDKANLGTNKFNQALDLLDDKVEIIREKLENRLIDLKNNRTKLTINGALPVNVGTYDFFAYSYGIEFARAKLVIEPIHVCITAKDVTKTYDGKPVDSLEAEISYYSYKTINGNVEKVAITELPNGMTEADLGLSYSLSNDDVNVGVYDIVVTAKDIKVANFANKVDTVNGTLTINPAQVTVNVADAEKYYGNVDPELTFTATAAVEGETLEFVTSREAGETAGTYEISAKLAVENPNYEITVNKGTLTIKPAEIQITVNDVDKQYNFEDPSDLTFEEDWSYIVVNGLTAENLKDLIGLTEEEVINTLNVVINREIPADGEDNLGDEFKLNASWTENSNLTVTANEDAMLRITLGDYVCWNMQTGVYYNDLSVALEDVDDENTIETIQMLKDFTETDYIIIAPGTTLDLDVYTVVAENYMVGFDGSYLDGNTYRTDGKAYAKLITKKSFSMLTDGSFVDSAGYNIVPMYHDGAYVFARFEVNTNRASNENRGLVVDEADKSVYFQFLTRTTKTVRENLMADGIEDNKVTIMVRLVWENGNGRAQQDYVYRADYVQEVAEGDKDFNFVLNGYDKLHMDINSLTVKGMVIADSGVTAYSAEWTK